MKDFRTIYKTLARTKQLDRYHMVQYAILKAIRDHDPTWHRISLESLADVYLKRAFTPITRKSKLDNGREPFDTIYWTLFGCGFSILASDPDNIFSNNEELEKYHAIIKALQTKYSFTKTSEYLNRHYVYTFVRQDISPEYQLVQAAHAAAKMGYSRGRIGDATDFFDGLYFAVIGVANDEEMAIAIKDCKDVGLKTYCFFEPDIGNVLTAFSTSPCRADKRKRLLSYKKLKFKTVADK